MNIKTLFNTDDERAVSPVIGVILMVAITVILAAVIGAFVLDLGSNQQENVNAGINAEQVNSSGAEFQVTDMGNAQEIDLQASGGNVTLSSNTLGSVGDSTDAAGLTSGDTVTIVAVDGDNENVIQTYEHD